MFIAAALLSLPACKDRSAPPAEQGKPASAASPQAPADQPVNPDAKALAGLIERVNEYVAIMDENPGIPTLKVNERYPDTVPLSTIPPQVLEGLPKLPEEMEFRFVGNSLILMDVHAHTIADFVPHAFPQ